MNKEFLKQELISKGYKVGKFDLLTSDELKNIISNNFKKYKSLRVFINEDFYNLHFGKSKRILIPKNKITYKLDSFIKTLL